MITDTQLMMGMPITVMTPDISVKRTHINALFDFFRRVDATYSPFIKTSDVSKMNEGTLEEKDYSNEFRHILKLAEDTKTETHGYFDVWHNGVFDPSGIVKGWAISEAATMMRSFTGDFYIEAGGDIQVRGRNGSGEPWKIGIRNPFERSQNISVISLDNLAVATSGTAIRGQHIYDPIRSKALTDIVSISVVTSDIIDADRMATAAFAIGPEGIAFIESLEGYEGYMVDKSGIATMTSGWKGYEIS